MSLSPRHPAYYPRAGYTDAEREFLMAMERYMRESRRPFPCWHEVLRVLVSLGYRKVENADKENADKETPRRADTENAP